MAEDTKFKIQTEKSIITQIKEYQSSGNSLEVYYYPNNIMTEEMTNKTVIFMAMRGKNLCDEKLSNLQHFKDGSDTGSLSEVVGMAVLPLTSALSDDQGHTWQENTYVSAITGGLEGAVGSGLSGKLLGKIAQGISGAIKFEEKSSQAMGVLADGLGVRKPLLNPGQFQNYSGSSLRSFSFDFTFIPESEAERDQVINIIKFFKRCSSPSTPKWTKGTDQDSVSSRMMMLAPMTWEVFVCNKTVNDLLSFHKCVCTKVSLKYGDSEKVAMFRDGMIKQISLGLSFSECELQTSRSYGDTEEWSDILSRAGDFLKNTGMELFQSFTGDSSDSEISDASTSSTSPTPVYENVQGRLPEG